MTLSIEDRRISARGKIGPPQPNARPSAWDRPSSRSWEPSDMPLVNNSSTCRAR